jgi:hypothetical protein
MKYLRESASTAREIINNVAILNTERRLRDAARHLRVTRAVLKLCVAWLKVVRRLIPPGDDDQSRRAWWAAASYMLRNEKRHALSPGSLSTTEAFICVHFLQSSELLGPINRETWSFVARASEKSSNVVHVRPKSSVCDKCNHLWNNDWETLWYRKDIKNDTSQALWRSKSRRP